MKFPKNILNNLQEYLLTHNSICLENIANDIANEQVNPSLVHPIMTVNIYLTSMEKELQEKSVLKLAWGDVSFDSEEIPDLIDKLIRVRCIDQPKDSVILFEVAHTDDDRIILLPELL